MIITTTGDIEGHTINAYLGIVAGEAVVGANAIVGLSLDYEVVGTKGSMLMVIAAGTAVTLATKL
jgi:uncharacterized protein YbjQ (UPF0145 family)